jgi:CubicO group peptidase (beta-lactamase class C family)
MGDPSMPVFRMRLLFALFALFSWSHVPIYAQEGGRIDIDKVNPAGLFLDKYSFMTQPNSFYYFHNMDQLNFQLDWVHKGGRTFALKAPKGNFAASYTFRGERHTLDEYFERNFVLGFLILHDDQILLEKYFHGADENSRFLSDSVAKSFVSVLIGEAIEDKTIKSVNDSVIQYLPYLSNSGFRDTTIKNLLQMSSGLQFNEDYLKPDAEVQRYIVALLRGKPSLRELAASIPSKTKPGTQNEYQSINTEVLGFVLQKATGKPLNEYLQEKLWTKIGPQSDAFFFRSKKQPEICAAGFLSVALRDYGRFGLMVMNAGTLGGQRIVPESWIRESSTPDADFLKPKPEGPKDQENFGYGYQWWIPYGNDRVIMALGIYGQAIYVNPTRHVVIVQTGAWPEPDTDERWDETVRVMETIAHQIQP